VKRHRLVWPLVAAVVLGLALYVAGDGLADASQVKAPCKAEQANPSACPGAKTMAPKPSQGVCTGASAAPCPTPCATPCASAGSDAACSATCCSNPPRVCGPRYRRVFHDRMDCSCERTSCRLYGLRCGHSKRMMSRSGCTMNCPMPCTDKNVKVMKMKCPPGCEKPCCAPDGVHKTMLRKMGSDDAECMLMRECDDAMSSKSCDMRVRVTSGEDGECIWVEREDGGRPRVMRAFKECEGSGATKVKKIRVTKSGADEKAVKIEEMGGDEDEDYVYEESPNGGGAWLGVYLQDLTPELREAFDLPADLKGALVTDVVRSGPARKSGVREGFVIVGFNGKPVTSADELVKMVQASKPGEHVKLLLNRKGEEVVRRVTLEKSPQERLVIRTTPELKKKIRVKKPGMTEMEVEIPDIEIETPEMEPKGMAPGAKAMRPAGGFLGVGVEDLPADMWKRYGDRGVLVNEVMDGSPAAAMGLETGDVILAIDGEDVVGPTDMVEGIRARGPGDVIVLNVMRNGEPMKMKAELAGRGPSGSMMAPPSHPKTGADMMKLQQRINELEKELQGLKKQLKETKGK
jgi:membrane-associated protease RseP (regulator of RpoE activity)